MLYDFNFTTPEFDTETDRIEAVANLCKEVKANEMACLKKIELKDALRHHKKVALFAYYVTACVDNDPDYSVPVDISQACLIRTSKHIESLGYRLN